jgi:hypothetical protein
MEALKGGWLLRLSKLNFNAPEDSSPIVHIGPITAGEKVLSDTHGEVYKLLRKNYGDTLAVEMEGAGFFRTVHANTGVHAIVIRGILDLVDDKENSDRAGWQEVASDHASAFAFELLTKMALEGIESDTGGATAPTESEIGVAPLGTGIRTLAVRVFRQPFLLIFSE